MYAAGVTAPPTMIMLANIFDAVAALAYGLGGGNGDPPESIAEKYYIENEHESEKEYESFTDGAAFEARRKALLDKINKKI